MPQLDRPMGGFDSCFPPARQLEGTNAPLDTAALAETLAHRSARCARHRRHIPRGRSPSPASDAPGEPRQSACDCCVISRTVVVLKLEIEKLAVLPALQSRRPCSNSTADGAITYYNAAALELARSLGYQRDPAVVATRGCRPPSRADASRLVKAGSEQETQMSKVATIACLLLSRHPGLGVVHCYASDVTDSANSRKIASPQQAALLDEAVGHHHRPQDLDQRMCSTGIAAPNASSAGTAAEVLRDARRRSSFLYKDSSCASTEARRACHVARSEWSGELECLTHDGGPRCWSKAVGRSCGTPSGRPEVHPHTLQRHHRETPHVQDQFLRAQRLESIGTLASGIAHDLNNILSPIMMSVNLLQERFTDDSEPAPVARDLARRRSSGRPTWCARSSPSPVARTVAACQRPPQAARLPRLPRFSRSHVPEEHFAPHERRPRPVVTSKADATQLYQVLMNLSVNARDAMPKGGLSSASTPET